MEALCRSIICIVVQITKKANIGRELKNIPELMRCAEEFNILGDPTRLKICYLLCRHGELSVGEIADIVGVSVSAVSRTLRRLEKAKLVQGRRDFRHVYYQLTKSPLARLIRGRLTNI